MLVLALLPVAAPARAAFPGENGPLAVTAGRAVQCSRETGQYYRWQSLALRGRRVAPIALPQEYLSGRTSLGIAVEYPDGAFSTWAVPPSTGDLGDPAWGPDAERVVFTRSVLSPHDKYGQAEIPWVTVVDSEGGPEHRIARGTAPSWSAADRIIYRGGKRGLFSISPTGRGRRHLTHGATDDDPDWAPSGGSFASSRGGAIWVGHAGAARARSPVRREGRRTRRRPGARTAGASRSSASARAAPSAPRTPATWRAWRHAAAGGEGPLAGARPGGRTRGPELVPGG